MPGRLTPGGRPGPSGLPRRVKPPRPATGQQPFPVPGRLILWSPEVDGAVIARNAKPATPTQERAGGWRQVPRPGFRPLLAWDGNELLEVEATIVIDSMLSGGGDIEPSIEALRALGRKIPDPGPGRPPWFLAIGKTPFPGTKWVIDGGLKIDVTWDHGAQVRAVCTIPLLEYSTTDIKPRITKTTPAQKPYTWKKGDTLAKVAGRLHVSQDALRKANPSIKSWSAVKPGRQIKNPGYADGTAAPIKGRPGLPT